MNVWGNSGIFSVFQKGLFSLQKFAGYRVKKAIHLIGTKCVYLSSHELLLPVATAATIAPNSSSLSFSVRTLMRTDDVVSEFKL